MIIVIAWRKNRNIFYSKLYIFVNPNYVKVYFLMLSQCTRASYSETSCTDPILGNAFDAKRKKKGWPYLKVNGMLARSYFERAC